MDHHKVLVRAFGGEPLEMIAIREAGNLVYVANPGSLARIASEETWPVGVPSEDVFVFDAETFKGLRQKWLASGGFLEKSDWRELRLRLFVATSRSLVA